MAVRAMLEPLFTTPLVFTQGPVAALLISGSTWPSCRGRRRGRPAREQQGILREGAGMLDALEAALGRWEVRRLLGGAYDRGPAMLSIQVLQRCCSSTFVLSSPFALLWFQG